MNAHQTATPALLARRLGESGQPETICKAVADEIRKVRDYSFITILLARKDGDAQRVFSTDHQAYPLPFSKPFPEGLRKRVLEQQEPLLVRGSEEYRQVYHQEDVFASTGARSLLTLPIKYDGSAVAALCFGAPEIPDEAGFIQALEARLAVLGPVMALLQLQYA
jgi:hypothetical protein